jgi:hypothetical protein
LNSWKLAPKGRAPGMGRVTTGVYKGVHEDCEPPCNAAMASAVGFKTAPQGLGAGYRCFCRAMSVPTFPLLSEVSTSSSTAYSIQPSMMCARVTPPLTASIAARILGSIVHRSGSSHPQ